MAIEKDKVYVGQFQLSLCVDLFLLDMCIHSQEILRSTSYEFAIYDNLSSMKLDLNVLTK